MQPVLDVIYGIILAVTGMFIDTDPDTWLQTGTNGHPPPLVIILASLGAFGVIVGIWISSRINDAPAIIVLAMTPVLIYGFLVWNWLAIVGSIGVIVLVLKAFGSNEVRDRRQKTIQDDDDYRKYKKGLK